MNRNSIAIALATALGAGYVPKAPGTAGALVGVLAFALGAPPLLSALLLLLPAVWASTTAARATGSKDPQVVVIDEVIGQWVTLVGASTAPVSLAAGFVLFRLFDIVKPWPVRWCEKAPEGWGIVLDDVMAGVYGFLVMLLLRWGNLIN
jgi:phosphatidylglycerophosphatase A